MTLRTQFSTRFNYNLFPAKILIISNYSNIVTSAVRLSRHFLIPWTGGAFAPLGPFLCPTTEEKEWPITPKPGPRTCIE
jgi:hypothetical protein